MNLTEVKKSLDKLFAAPPKQGAARNIVFWYDDTGAFAEQIDTLGLEGNVKTFKVFDDNQFAAKLYIERGDTENHLLIYSPMPRPSDRDNWLADTLRYSQTFATDEASLILINYKMDISLRQVAQEYAAFFRSDERIRRFDGFGFTDWTERKFDIAVLSALCKQKVPNFDACIRAILTDVIAAKRQTVESIMKYGSMKRLWKLIRDNYGYSFAEDNFERLAVTLLVTHFAHSFARALPKAWEEYNTQSTNCFVLIDSFMKDVSSEESYQAICAFVADKLDLGAYMTKWDIASFLECDTFPELDEAIIARIRGNILSDAGEYDAYKKIINSRHNRRWFGKYENEYNVLHYACELLSLIHHNAGFSAASLVALWEKYRDDFSRFDYFYRKFLLNLDALAHRDDWSGLAEKVENTYTNGYLSDLSVKWCELLDESTDSMGTVKWEIPDVESQMRFFDRYVNPFLQKDERVIVVISDALRYETAAEYMQILNKEFKGECSLTEMLGVVPSYTALGMAALLPHKDIEITDKGEIFVDGINSKGTENREKILKTVKNESVAITFDSLKALSKAQLSEKFNGIKLIYVYHNTIDARGDNASTEHEVFDATEKAFNELTLLIRKLTGGISAINILITADHGYVYRRTPLHVSDKTPKNAENSIRAKRRYIMTKEAVEIQGTQEVSLRYLGQDSVTAIFPRGINVFPIQGGGANFVHGGTSLQEIMIPLIKFKNGKNYTKAAAAQKVTISLSSLSRKITSIITPLEFFQNEPVGDKLMPLRVKAFFEDESGDRISNENIIIADSASPEPAGRAFREKFTLRNIEYDKKSTYYLVLQDDDDMVGHEIMRIPYAIDLVFGSGIRF